MDEHPSILIIDDDNNIRKSMAIWLMDEGFHVFSASRGEEAMAIVKENNIAICLIDLRLDEEDGVELSQKLKSIDSIMKIIIITAYPGYQTAIEAIKSGIYDYVSKTEDNDFILSKINRAIEARRDLLQSKERPSDQYNIVLLCHHFLTIEGIKKFCKESNRFSFLHAYTNYSQVRDYNFNLKAELILICASCHKEIIEDNMPMMFTNIRSLFPKGKILIINSVLNDDEKKKLLFLKVKGFLPPNIQKKALKKAFEQVIKGEIWVNRELSSQVLDDLLSHNNHPEYEHPKKAYDLSPRELEILKALSAGLSNSQISHKLCLSEKTVKTHVYNIFKKMDVNTRTKAVMKGIKAFII